MDLWNNVLAINDDGCSSRRAQSDVQNCAVFSDVDFLAPKHRVNPPTQSGLICELQE